MERSGRGGGALRIAMCLANCMAQPMSGMRRISILEMYLTAERAGQKPSSIPLRPQATTGSFLRLWYRVIKLFGRWKGLPRGLASI